MAKYTKHYQLHQWEASDAFLRTDFNTDFKKIDTALQTANTACVAGSYTGNNSTITVNLGFKPSFLAIVPTGHTNSYNSDIVGVYGFSEAMTRITRNMSCGIFIKCQFTSTGFTVTDTSLTTSGLTFLYAAFR